MCQESELGTQWKALVFHFVFRESSEMQVFRRDPELDVGGRLTFPNKFAICVT